jgi:hypothetical protein
MGLIYEATAEVASDGMKELPDFMAAIYVPSFIKTGFAFESYYCGINTQTGRQQGNLISLLLFFQNKVSRLKC